MDASIHRSQPTDLLKKILPQSLPVLFGAERTDAVQAEAEDKAVLLANADVKGVILRGERAAVVCVADSDQRAYQRVLA